MIEDSYEGESFITTFTWQGLVEMAIGRHLSFRY